jgi:solute carrier family 13 (sodium-dependent dicarboxylate transporter), member 2/3/5
LSEQPGINSDIKEVISSGEEKFEKWRNKIGLFLGPLAGLIYYFTPPGSLSYQAHTLSAILIWIIIWWITEPIPIPASALLGAALCILLNVADAKKVFAPFADPIVFLFLGSFILAGSMAKHGVDKRFAYKILSIKGVVKSTGRIIFTFGAIAAFISMWISNTAATAMMYPIAIGIIHAVTKMISSQDGKNIEAKKTRFATALMLMTAYAASTGGIGTPVGTPPNLIGIAMIEKFAHIKISFFQWMQFAVPMLIIMFVVLFFLLYFLNKPEAGKLKYSGDFIKNEIKKLGKITRGEVNSIIAFAITVILWVTPGFLAIFFGNESEVYKNYNNIMPESVAAVTGAILLFLLPVNWKKKEFTINWKDAVNIDWGTLLLFGGGLTLGNLMFETKLADVIGKNILGVGGLDAVWAITFASIYMAIFLSEATSNTASANMIVPVVISICLAGNINPLPPAIGATLGASWGFMLPVSTPPNAIVYGSKMVPITKMIRSGIVFDLLGGVLIWLVLRIILPLINLG